ncbi:MAG: 30S ribosomal protein S2 [Candidatus Daviesbacteria bacterium]|nr:30S ribosomal protein S2 [Candidatus Daviesbacteria bacterium]
MSKVPTLQELLEAGVHFGHQVRRGHPKMQQYIYGVRDGVHIIDLGKSEKKLKEAIDYVEKLGKEGKVLLFLGTKKQAQPIVKELAERAGAPYVTYRWVGGFLTNFDEVRKNIKKLLDLKDKQEKGELTHYTKKEQLLISKKLVKFENELGGIAKFDRLPDAIFIIDTVAESTAVAEAIRIDLPIVGICDTNSNPLLINHPIPANDDASKSIQIITEAIADAYAEGLKSAGKIALKKQEESEKQEEVVAPNIAEEVAAAEEEVEKKAVLDSERIV